MMRWIVFCTLGMIFVLAPLARAEQPSDPMTPFLKDWAALDGAVSAASSSREHVATDLKAVFDAMQHQVKASDDRLKWVLDNWVPKQESKQ